MRCVRIALSVLLPLTALTIASPAHAAPAMEIEPNDTILQVTATANVDGLQGRMDTSDDVDYFWLGLRPQRQVTITATAAGCRYGSEGRVILTSSIFSLAPYHNSSSSASITTPGVFGGPTDYFRVRASRPSGWYGEGCAYTLTVKSATGGTTDAIDPTPPTQLPVLQLPEPDDLPAQATGPLAGDTGYQGAISTSNDVDRVYFHQRAGAAVNVRLRVARGSVKVGSHTANSTYPDTILSAGGGSEDVYTFAVSGSDATRHLVVSGDEGSVYEISVSPPSSLGITPQPPAPPAPPPVAKPTRISLKAKPKVVRRGGVVTLRIKANVSRRLKIKIWQRNTGPGKRWVLEAVKRTNARGALRHREDVRTGNRHYRACWRKVCSKKVLVRVRR